MSLTARIRRRLNPLHRLRDTRFGNWLLCELLNRDVSVPMPGIAFNVDVNIGAHLGYMLFPSSMEPGVTRVVRKALKYGKSNLFIDVGANFGYYTWLAQTIDPSIVCVAIDPEPRNCRRLRNTSQRSPGRTYVLEMAASSATGQATFHRDRSTGFRGKIGVMDDDDSQTLTVNTVTLDNLVDQFGIPDLVKIDVEGHEIEVLKGSPGLLESGTSFVIEVTETTRPEIIRLLEPRHRVVPVEPEDADLAHASYIFASPRDAAGWS